MTRQRVEITEQVVKNVRSGMRDIFGLWADPDSIRRCLEAALNPDLRKGAGDRRQAERTWSIPNGGAGAAEYIDSANGGTCGTAAQAKPEAVPDCSRMAESSTVAVGPVPNRTDGLISLHVGNTYVLLSTMEVRRLIADLTRANSGAY